MDEGFLTYSWGRRLWLVGWGPPYRIWFSERWDSVTPDRGTLQPNRTGTEFGPPFHQHGWIDIDPPAPDRSPQAITALVASLQPDELVIWKDTGAWILSGSSPETFALRKYVVEEEENA